MQPDRNLHVPVFHTDIAAKPPVETLVEAIGKHVAVIFIIMFTPFHVAFPKQAHGKIWPSLNKYTTIVVDLEFITTIHRDFKVISIASPITIIYEIAAFIISRYVILPALGGQFRLRFQEP